LRGLGGSGTGRQEKECWVPTTRGWEKANATGDSFRTRFPQGRPWYVIVFGKDRSKEIGVGTWFGPDGRAWWGRRHRKKKADPRHGECGVGMEGWGGGQGCSGDRLDRTKGKRMVVVRGWEKKSRVVIPGAIHLLSRSKGEPLYNSKRVKGAQQKG